VFATATVPESANAEANAIVTNFMVWSFVNSRAPLHIKIGSNLGSPH
jgi:hypothetical protein